MLPTDTPFLDQAILQAREAYAHGNYPVGAVLTADGKVIAAGANAGESSGNYSNHAETALVIAHGAELLQLSRTNAKVTLYSTLEPCLMCLGVATMNKINRIVYLQADPHAGACSIDRTSLGLRYQQIWPEIIHADYSDEPRQLLIKFMKEAVTAGRGLPSHSIMIELFEKQ